MKAPTLCLTAFVALLALPAIGAAGPPALRIPATDQHAVELSLTGRVVDAADLLSSEEEAALGAELAQIEKETMAQLVVVTTPGLNGQPIERFSLDLANRWGIGSPERNDGIMLLVAPKQRRVRIEVGLGLEEIIPDMLASDVIEKNIIPHFRLGDFPSGIQSGVDRLGSELRAELLKEAA